MQSVKRSTNHKTSTTKALKPSAVIKLKTNLHANSTTDSRKNDRKPSQNEYVRITMHHTSLSIVNDHRHTKQLLHSFSYHRSKKIINMRILKSSTILRVRPDILSFNLSKWNARMNFIRDLFSSYGRSVCWLCVCLTFGMFYSFCWLRN